MNEKRVYLSEDAFLHEMGEEAIILNTVNHQYYSLDAVGTRMLHLLLHCSSIDDAVICLVNEYDAQQGQIERDMRELIETLLDQGLVVLS